MFSYRFYPSHDNFTSSRMVLMVTFCKSVHSPFINTSLLTNSIYVRETAFTLPLMSVARCQLPGFRNSPTTFQEMSPQGLKCCLSYFTLVFCKQIKQTI